jgi:hypothetical protein
MKGILCGRAEVHPADELVTAACVLSFLRATISATKPNEERCFCEKELNGLATILSLVEDSTRDASDSLLGWQRKEDSSTQNLNRLVAYPESIRQQVAELINKTAQHKEDQPS